MREFKKYKYHYFQFSSIILIKQRFIHQNMFDYAVCTLVQRYRKAEELRSIKCLTALKEASEMLVVCTKRPPRLKPSALAIVVVEVKRTVSTDILGITSIVKKLRNWFDPPTLSRVTEKGPNGVFLCPKICGIKI